MNESSGKVLPAVAIAAEYQGDDLESLAVLRRYREWIVDYFDPFLSGAAVEFGAGVGSISELLVPRVESLDLVEPSPNLVGQLTDRFSGSDNMSIHGDSLEDFSSSSVKQYDSVVIVNVLEHIDDDARALKQIFGALKPGGHLLVLVPALPFLFSKLDGLVGHHRRYTRAGLDVRIREAGFEPIRSRYFDLLGIMPWLVLNTWCGATKFNPVLATIYDFVFVPISRVLESIVAPPLGKNVIMVARRPK